MILVRIYVPNENIFLTQMFADLLKQLYSTSRYFQIFHQYFDNVVKKKQQRLKIKITFGLRFLHQLIIEIFSERFSLISICSSYVCIMKNVNGRCMGVEANLTDITSMNKKLHIDSLAWV